MDDLKALGSIIRERRRALKLTQEDLAEKADVHPVYLAKLEGGSKNVTFKTLVKVIAALDTTFCEIACAYDVRSQSQ